MPILFSDESRTIVGTQSLKILPAWMGDSKGKVVQFKHSLLSSIHSFAILKGRGHNRFTLLEQRSFPPSGSHKCVEVCECLCTMCLYKCLSKFLPRYCIMCVWVYVKAQWDRDTCARGVRESSWLCLFNSTNRTTILKCNHATHRWPTEHRQPHRNYKEP